MLSRRQFLQAAGIAVAAAHLPRWTPAAPNFEPLYGRALYSIPVYAAPQADAALVKYLWSDTVTPILDAQGTWVRLPDGYTQRENLQPMIAPAQRIEAPAAPPFWGEVGGALAIVREWCAADAPILARIGHGGVLRIIDRLSLNGIDWYGVAARESGDLLGWSQATVWSPASVDIAHPSLTLSIDTQTQQMNVRDGAQHILSAPISTGRDLLPSVYPITGRHPTPQQPSEYLGASWALTFGTDLDLAGVYWHNRFGIAPSEGARIPGAVVQVTPPLARWLYPRATQVIIS